jgi:hypothetical protein
MTVACDFFWNSEIASNIYKDKHRNNDNFEIQPNRITEKKKFKSIKNYDLGIKFTQQEFSNDNQFTSKATLVANTAVLSRGKWPKNCVNGRVSFDSGKKFFNIVSHESENALTLDGIPKSGRYGYIIRLNEFDLGELKLCAKRNAHFGFEDGEAKLNENSINVTNEYVSVCDEESIQTRDFSRIVSASVIETLNSQNIYYWLVFYPLSKHDEDIEVKVFNRDENCWRKIARNRAGYWEFNDSVVAPSETWVLASTNDFLNAVSEAISSQKANRMSGNDLTSINHLEWELINNLSCHVDCIARGVTLHSGDSKNSPSVSQFCLNFEN